MNTRVSRTVFTARNAITAFPVRTARRMGPPLLVEKDAKKRKVIYESEKDPKKLLLSVKVKPGSKKLSIVDFSSKVVGIQVHAQPRNGDANEELLVYLSNVFQIKKASLAIEKGIRSRSKCVSISNTGLSVSDVQQIIEKEMSER